MKSSNQKIVVDGIPFQSGIRGDFTLTFDADKLSSEVDLNSNVFLSQNMQGTLASGDLQLVKGTAVYYTFLKYYQRGGNQPFISNLIITGDIIHSETGTKYQQITLQNAFVVKIASITPLTATGNVESNICTFTIRGKPIFQ